MKYRKQFMRVLFFVFLLACLLTGLAGTMRAPVRAAPLMQTVTYIVISQVYGGGGNSGAPYTNDYVELFNPSDGPLSVNGWSIQYASATGGSFSNNVATLSGTLAPGQYYLVQLASGGTVGSPLPTPDATGSISMGASNGKVVLANTTTGLACNDSASCAPYLANIIDLVGYGTANFSEGNNPAPGLSNTTANLRNGNGCNDTNNNGVDFTEGTPTPRNIAFSPILTCGALLTATAGANLTGTASNLTNTAAALTNVLSPTNSATSSPAGTVFPALSLLINEVAWAGTTNTLTSDEWIELYNPGSSTIDLTGWILRADDNSPTISLSGSIPAGGYYLLERTDDTTVLDIPANLIYTGDLNNSTDTLRLFGPSGNVVDTANSNGGPWPAGTSTVSGTSSALGSMERRPGMVDSDVAWITNTGVVANGTAANGVALKGTPKNQNWAVSVTPTISRTPTRTRTPSRTPTITRTPTPLPPPPLLVINEFVPRPGHDWNGDGIVNVGDEYIEILNHGVVDVDLSGHTLDDEVNIGSPPYRLPSVVLEPGERYVFFESETGLQLSDGGDGVRLLKPNGQLFDAYNYTVVRYPDHTYCRYPDNGGADDWNTNCFPTPWLQNSLSGISVPTPEGGVVESACPLSDTQPADFIWAECQPFGQNIFRPAFWDRTGWFGEKYLPESPGKWPVFVD
jgi:hypothetical protein